MRTALPLVVLVAAAAVAVATRIEDPRRLVLAAVLAIAALAGLFGLLVLTRRLRRRRIRDWRDAELAAARWLRKAGCRDVALTGGSADGGIDVITVGWAVQVKHTSKRVGRPVAQQVVGASLALGRQPAVVSTSGFTAPAIDYADEHDVALLELDLDGRIHRLNPASRHVGKRPRRLPL